MIQDLHSLGLDSNTYCYALNAVLGDLTGEEFLLQNESSNILKVVFPEGCSVVGHKVIQELGIVLYFLINDSGESQLGYVRDATYTSVTDKENVSCDNSWYNQELKPLEKITQTPFGFYTKIIDTTCLKLNRLYPIDIEYRVTDCGLNLYFTDYLNPRRFLYLDRDLNIKKEFLTISGFDPTNCNLPIYTDELDCNKVLFNPEFSKPCVNLVDVGSNGQLKAGVYQFIVGYADRNGNPLTNYFPASSTIPIFNKSLTVVTDYITHKSITVDISNLDTTTFLYYNLVVVETINNFTEFKLLGTFPVNPSGTERYTYTGNPQDSKNLSSSDVFFRRPYYSTAKTVTKANNYLFFSGLREYNLLNLQSVISGVKLYWQTAAIPEAVYAKERNTFYFRTYQRDEVYSFGIVFEFKDGWETCAFHIPGNSASYYLNTYGINVLSSVPATNPDIIIDESCTNGTLDKYWQVNNTSSVIPSMSLYQFSENCSNNSCWEAGDFGYYESTEKYPNNPLVWGDLCGQPIRFHKFPDSSISHIHDSKCGSKHFNESNIVHPIGVRVDHQSVLSALTTAVSNGLISQEDRDKIVGYRIVRGNRSGHKSIVAKGLLYDMWTYQKDSKNYYYANYPFNDLNNDVFISNDKNTYTQNNWNSLFSLPNSSPAIPSTYQQVGRYTFHSPDVHFTNPQLGNILKLETVEYGESEGFFNFCEDQAKYKRMTYFARLIALGMGVAAALSSTEEKDCVTYTIKSDYKTKQKKYQVDSKGETPVGHVTGALTLGTGSITTNVQNHNWSGTADVPEIDSTQDNSVCLGFYENNKSDGKVQNTSQNKIIDSSITDLKNCKDIDGEHVVSEYSKSTCTGTPHQLLSTNTDNTIMNGINKFLKILLGDGPQVIQQVLIGMREMDIVLKLIESLIPYKNYAIQYNSVGRYNNFCTVPSGIKQRKIKRAVYLEPTMQTVNNSFTTSLSDTSVVNNWNRERSVYLNVEEEGIYNLLKPHQVNGCIWPDNSRVTMSDAGLSYNDLNKRIIRNIASYYASIKNFIPNQYGSIHNISYLETSPCLIRLDSQNESHEYTVYGGDTFINRFALKRKLPFFLQSRFKQLDGTDVTYSELGNVGYPNYYIDSQKALFDRLSGISAFTSLLNPLSMLDEIVGLESARLDVKPVNLFYQKGYMYLYSYGIPYFFVESDVNVDFRHGENNQNKDFYPNNSFLEEWLQEKNVPITEDNYYFYNPTYSKQNTESFICVSRNTFENGNDCVVKHPNRIIYSEEQSTSADTFDNWRIFKANSFYDFPLSDGLLTSADGIENYKVLVRLENNTKVFNAYNLIQTDVENIQVGTGGMFKSRPQDFAITDLGYAGSQHKSLINTEFGHLWVDAKRGNIFNLGLNASGLDEITKNGMRNWFKENLVFQIQKEFNLPQEVIDNNLNGIGITIAFDRRFSRIIITKLDYTCKNKDVRYDDGFYIEVGGERIPVSLRDPQFFCDKSWTVSYNLATKTWVSFHSYKPLFYNSFIDNFESCSVDSIWAHSVTNTSYQVFNGILQPFIVEYLTKPDVSNNVINALEFTLDVIRYQNKYDYFYNQEVTFNKAIIYNDRQCSGLLELIPRDSNNLLQVGLYPRQYPDRTQVLVTNSENTWRVNSFDDLINSQTSNVPMFKNTCANDYKELNNKALDYLKPSLNRSRLRAHKAKVRLINDCHSNYHFIFNFSLTNQKTSFR